MGGDASITYLIAMVTRLHGNHSDMSVTPLSYVVLSPYLVQRLFGKIGFSHIPRCYSN